ncbi:MAG: DNA primase [Bacteroidales bacterium]|nr:DNA primase [Bacteroidales bacterium]
MIPQDTVREILDTARIEEVVGDFVTLKRRGGNFVACCPFHNEKTPSFYVSPSKGIYKCFGCGKAGSAVGFVMEYEHLGYAEALKYLARKYGIEVVEKEESAEEIAARQRNESLLLASEFAYKFFREALGSDEGRAIGYQYFRSRGLEDETIEKYGLGWAPRSRHAFTDAALKEGYKAEYLTETGLCAQWEDGSLHDRFYDRVMFPIHSVSGRVIAFGGRTLLSDKTVAKYVNSKESEIYVKSRSLYGIYFAKNEISRTDKCYLVEGYLDVLSMHQIGITNVVASSGTSLTIEQIRLIKKFTQNITIMYDGDAAGIHAALRGIGMVLAEGLNVKVVLLPDGDDPDSYSRKHSREEIESFIAAHEQDFISFKTDLLLQEAGNDPIKKANLINDIADTIAEIPDAVKRSVYVDMVAEKFRIEAEILFTRIRRVRDKSITDGRAQAERERSRSEHRTSDGAVTVAVTPSAVQNAMTTVENDAFMAPTEKELLTFILRDGTTPLEFESDSPFYSPDSSQTVAEFIDAALAGDGSTFSNTVYQDVYDAYFKLMDEGLKQVDIIRRLLDSPDRNVAYATGQLSEQQYQITVQNFKDSLTTNDSWLVKYVPRAILAYQEKRCQKQIRILRSKLSGASADEQTDILRMIGRLNSAIQKINENLGREKSKHR